VALDRQTPHFGAIRQLLDKPAPIATSRGVCVCRLSVTHDSTALSHCEPSRGCCSAAARASTALRAVDSNHR
jgi:hypothetical protein